MSFAESVSVRSDQGSQTTREWFRLPGSGLIETTGLDLTPGPVWIFPGLGCRHVGMGHDLFDINSVASALFDEANLQLGFDLKHHCLEGSGRKFVPARDEARMIYTVSCAYAAALLAKNQKPAAVAGHSLGNWAAGWAAGLYDFATGLDLVTLVEDLLEELIPTGQQTMGAVIGLPEEVVESILGNHPNVWLANRNSPGQYIVAGDSDGVESVLATAASMNAKRSKRLPTERALHTPLMRKVSERLRQSLETIRFFEPEVPFVSSADSRILRTAGEAREFFGTFLDQPVCWEESVRSLFRRSVPYFVEVGPGNVLGSMFPFLDPSAKSISASELLLQDAAI